MKRIFIALALFIFSTSNTFSQSLPEKKFSQQQLKEDLAYLKQQLFDVHINPYTELNKEQYEQLFASINAKLKDSLSATDFLKLIKPTIAYLSDEHAGISLQTKLLTQSYKDDAVFCPLSLTKDGSNYKVAKVLSGQLDLQDKVIAKIDGLPIEVVLNKCALYTAGYPDQRKEKTLTQFGSLYTLSLPCIQHQFTVRTSEGKTIIVKGVTLQTWQDELGKQAGWNETCSEAISYQKIDNAGYINACSFMISDKKWIR